MGATQVERRRYFVAEVRCYWCGTLAGTVEGGWPLLPGTLLFRGTAEPQRLVPARLTTAGVRCRRCGGPCFVDEFDVVTLRPDKPYDVDATPRRGRPPKRPR